MTVEVKIIGEKINEINVLDNQETPTMITTVEETLIPQIIKGQTIEAVDTVSGATNSSNAVLDAVGQSLAEATK
ncbi:FMN-binding protein [Alkalibaculum sp. M08DMB]|uniref:FMN-binding protein n=2 Tax=Alkalibaculum sporogenes TaxID=2655001 RepID=A0A6A7KBS5_9FIRM|nr:FMN-binding protein [Alkalibaculum sporogenes]